MIERKFVAQKIKEFQIQDYISANVKRVGHSKTKVVRTPLGEKIVIYASRPGLIVGKSGQNIKKLTKVLKTKYNLENPQIEISEVESPDLDATIVAERIATSLEKFGSQKFKAIGHKAMSDVMNAGARGVEIVISGKIPSSRAKSWRFYQGYLKKSGDIAVNYVKVAFAQALLKTGIIGVQVRIMPPDLKLPDDITFKGEEESSAAMAKVEEEKLVKPEPKKAKRSRSEKRPKREGEKKPRKKKGENVSPKEEAKAG